MQTLTLTKTVGSFGDCSFTLEGDLIDEEGAPFSVGEFTFQADRIEKLAAYYLSNFDAVQLVRVTIVE